MLDVVGYAVDLDSYVNVYFPVIFCIRQNWLRVAAHGKRRIRPETATNTSEPTFAEKYTNEEGYLGGETNKFGEYPYTIDHRDRMKKLDTYQLSLDRESSKYGSITATFKYGPTASYRVTNDSSSPSVMHEYMDREAGKTVTFADWKGGEKTSRSVENEQHSTPRQMWMGELPDDYGNYKFDHYMTEDGTDYAVFTATGGEDLRNEYPDTAEVSGKFVISENGLNKEVTLHATDSEGNTLYSYEMEVTGINETTVETPDWASSE